MLSDSNLASRFFISIIHFSNPSGVRWLCAGKLPTTPAEHEATTSSGPEDNNIGATTNGNFNRVNSAIMFNFLLTKTSKYFLPFKVDNFNANLF